MLIRNEGAIELSDAIKTNQSLLKLDISTNDLTCKSSAKFFYAISKSNIEDLDISENALGDLGVQNLS